ncbi:hypothetical protein CDAR_428391 [Caerostris darwini]|uniref:Uncharacterized protein n=1 Tax=Caerostris darwini TaxID=1538125 RepID=A0AAV4PDU1_9ARAC|nr:hypothetical protein CDAR_254101 [Caerostris darwini]GIX95597.1 hypothetical protein CDAR_428391 [Caerostris darwini]
MASEDFRTYAFRITDKTFLHTILNTVYIFVVGDEATGKTCLIRAFTSTRMKDFTLPSFEYVYTYTHQTIAGPLELRIVELRLEDLSLKEVRRVSLQLKKHVFLFVFSVDNSAGAYRLDRTWIACVKRAMGLGVPSALVCSKIDLRSHPLYSDKMHLLLDSEAVNGIRQSCGISSSFECSAVTGETVEQVFIGAAMIANKAHPMYN